MLIDFQRMGSREGVASKIDIDTEVKLQEMKRALSTQREQVIESILSLIYDIKPELHKNYRDE